MTPWFRMQQAASDPTVAEISIYDIIGGWIDEYLWEGGGPGVMTAKTFVTALAALPDSIRTIRLRLNSPGGDVFAALAIANALRDQRLSKNRTIDVVVDGLAASSASIVLMAGNTIRIGDNALVMIHNPWTVAIGTADEMRQAADELDTIRATIIQTYQWHSPLDAEALAALMDATTWMDADEAVANGFATEKIEGLPVAALLDPRGLSRLTVPEQYRARVEALMAAPATPSAPPTAAPAADVLRLCREGGCLELAEDLVQAGATADQVRARVEQAQRARAEAEARAGSIRAACSLARLPELADGYIAGATPLEVVRAQLTTLTARLDHVEIDGSLPPDAGAGRRPRIDAEAIYAERNRLKKE